jgi:act minimal PKS acyl carrier protein
VKQLTMEEFVEILRASAGEDEAVDLGGEIGDTPFADLGYDSLALLETAGRVQRTYGIDLGDETLAEADTPRRFLEAVNTSLAAGV